MAMTLPRTRKCAAYRSASISGVCGLTRNNSAGNGLALGEVVVTPRSAPPRCHHLGDATMDGSGEAMEKAPGWPRFATVENDRLVCINRDRRFGVGGFASK